MFDRMTLYNIIYALAARSGRDAALFGDCAPLALEAFERSLAGDGFPELWFELPLAGAPWFDLHALTAREDLRPDTVLTPETTGGYPEVFSWFAAQDRAVRQLALSWDVSSGNIEHPAVQLLVKEANAAVTCEFLEVAGRSDAQEAYRVFLERLPRNWFACYTGVFPERTVPFLRVECVLDTSLQKAYAEDATLLQKHLSQTGLAPLSDSILTRCQHLAKTPFRLEFQFDVNKDGLAGSTFSASVRFASSPGKTSWGCFDPDAEAGILMQRIEEWGLADERWRLLADTAFANQITFSGESALIYCFPAFIKLRWRDGEPVDAKTYLMAGMQQQAEKPEGAL